MTGGNLSPQNTKQEIIRKERAVPGRDNNQINMSPKQILTRVTVQRTYFMKCFSFGKLNLERKTFLIPLLNWTPQAEIQETDVIQIVQFGRVGGEGKCEK